MNKEFRIKNFPISFYSIVMGMSGLIISLQKAVDILGLSRVYPLVILCFTIFIFSAISLVYIVKIIKFPNEVKEEFRNPIKINFFPASSISFLLLSIVFLPINMLISKYLWLAGTVLHLIFTTSIISAWIHHNFKVKYMNPSWFIPAVGNIIVPVAGISHFPPEISWFFFSVGLFFWVILLVIFFNRIFFHEPLPEKLLPTLFILIAPPAVGFISYIKLTNSFNDFSKILFYFGLFLTILMFFQVNLFKKIKFYLSWWAYSFPLAAITIADALMYHLSRLIIFKYLFIILLVILCLIIVTLLIKTISSISKKEICVEEQ